VEFVSRRRRASFHGLPGLNCSLLDALADTFGALADPLRTRLDLIGCASGRGAVLLPGFVAGLSIRRLAPRRQYDQGNKNDPSETSHRQLHFSVSLSAGTPDREIASQIKFRIAYF
jgi:hypothetical protein